MSRVRWLTTVAVLALFVPAGVTAGADKKKRELQPSAVPEVTRVWPPPPQKPRIKLLQVVGGERDMLVKTKKSLVSRLVGDRSEEGFIHFRRPFGLTGDSRGRLYVTDTYLRGVFVLDATEREFRVFAAASDVGFRQPLGIAVDSQDRVWVADASLRNVLCYDREEKLLLMFGSDPGTGAKKTPILQRPAGLALDEKRQRVYVSDSKLHQIFVFDMKGKFLRQLGEAGSEPGQFSFPGTLFVDREGRLFVVDTMNARVQIFGPDFNLEQTVGGRCDTPGCLALPKGVALDSEDHLYVTDATFHNFQIFGHDPRDPDPQALSALLFVGEEGQRPGSFRVPGPIYINSQDQIFVADQMNGRIQVFQYLKQESN